MTGSSISILALYQFDPTIFDGLQLPDQLDRGEFVNNLLVEYAGMEVLYPDPVLIKQIITSWSAIRIDTWRRMGVVLYEDYNPFVNIKRDEERVIQQSSSLNTMSDVTGQVSAFNEQAFSNRDRSSGSSQDNGTATTRETFHLEGDSAITDVQDVLKKEMDVRIRYDLYRVILDEFKSRFLIMVY